MLNSVGLNVGLYFLLDIFMEYKINKLQLRILRWIAKKIVRQSHEHKNNVIDYYRVIAMAASDEFTEDNKFTLDEFLKECHEASLKI